MKSQAQDSRLLAFGAMKLPQKIMTESGRPIANRYCKGLLEPMWAPAYPSATYMASSNRKVTRSLICLKAVMRRCDLRGKALNILYIKGS